MRQARLEHLQGGVVQPRAAQHQGRVHRPRHRPEPGQVIAAAYQRPAGTRAGLQQEGHPAESPGLEEHLAVQIGAVHHGPRGHTSGAPSLARGPARPGRRRPRPPRRAEHGARMVQPEARFRAAQHRLHGVADAQRADPDDRFLMARPA